MIDLENTLVKTNTRNINIDLLRLLSMFLVAMIHITGNGIGDAGYINRYVCAVTIAFNAFSYCCINLFAMLSGYLMCEKRTKTRRIVRLWADVLFYSVAGVFTAFLISGDKTLISVDALKNLLPISTRRYWYISVYFALYFMIPFYNMLIAVLDKRKFSWLMIISLIGASVISTVFNMDPFNLGNGVDYSFVWISIMYFLGAYIKKYGLNLSQKKCFVLIVISELLICVSGLIPVRYRTLFGNAIVLKKYSSFAVVALSIAVFVFVLNMKLKVGPKMSRVIKSFSAASLAVYLTHTHPEIFNRWIVNGFKWMAQLSLPFVVICIIGISLAITIGGCLIGMAQHKLFELLKIYKLCDVVAEKLTGIKHKIDVKLAA